MHISTNGLVTKSYSGNQSRNSLWLERASSRICILNINECLIWRGERDWPFLPHYTSDESRRHTDTLIVMDSHPTGSHKQKLAMDFGHASFKMKINCMHMTLLGGNFHPLPKLGDQLKPPKSKLGWFNHFFMFIFQSNCTRVHLKADWDPFWMAVVRLMCVHTWQVWLD